MECRYAIDRVRLGDKRSMMNLYQLCECDGDAWMVNGQPQSQSHTTNALLFISGRGHAHGAGAGGTFGTFTAQ